MSPSAAATGAVRRPGDPRPPLPGAIPGLTTDVGTRARYEFRAWADSFPGLPQPSGAFSEEVYLLLPGCLARNVKLRDGALEIKELVSDAGGLQLWQPAARLAFPIQAAVLMRELLLLLPLGFAPTRASYGQEELLAELARARDAVGIVRLRKRRRLHEVAGCRAETAEVVIEGGRRLMSAAAEHADPMPLLRAVAAMDLAECPNLSYPAALARLRTAS